MFISNLENVTVDTVRMQIPSFMIRFGADIMEEYEKDGRSKEIETGKLLKMLIRGSLDGHLKLRNGALVAKSNIRYMFKTMIEFEYEQK